MVPTLRFSETGRIMKLVRAHMPILIKHIFSPYGGQNNYNNQIKHISFHGTLQIKHDCLLGLKWIYFPYFRICKYGLNIK